MAPLVRNVDSNFKRFRSDPWGTKLLGAVWWNIRKFKTQIKFFLFLKREKRQRRWARRQRYIYRLDVVNPTPRRHYYSKKFMTLRLARIFYITLTYKQFNKLARKAKKIDGFFGNNYLLALEGRLISFVYRTSFIATMWEAFLCIKSCTVVLNRKVRNYPNEEVGLFSILSFHPLLKTNIIRELIIRITLLPKRSIFNAPRYIYISYWFMFAFMFKPPHRKQLIFTLRNFDVYRATGYAGQ